MSSAVSWTDFIFSLFNCWTRPHSPVGLLPHSSHDVVASADRGRAAVPAPAFAPQSAFVPAPAFVPASAPASAPVVVVLEGDDQDDGHWEDWNDSVVVDAPAPVLAAGFLEEPPPSQTAASIFTSEPSPPPPSIFNPVPASPLPSIFNPLPAVAPLPSIFNPVPSAATPTPAPPTAAAEPAEEPEEEEEDLFADMQPVYVAPTRLHVEQPRPVQSIPQDALSDHAASSPPSSSSAVSQPVPASVFDDEPVEGHGAWSDDEPIFASEEQGREEEKVEKAADQEQPAPARQGKRTKKERVRVTKASVSFHDDDF